MTAGLPAWVDEARKLPLGFAQVREDPALDQLVVDRLGGGARVVMVASGGCTAAALAASATVGALHLVDPNPAQMALARLKLRLLQGMEPRERLAVLGHAPMPPHERAAALAETLAALDLGADVLGPAQLVAAIGPDQAGRYERLFAALRETLRPHAASLEALLALAVPGAQADRLDSRTPLGAAVAQAFEATFALPILVALFGEEATRNPRETFAAHFLGRLRWVLASQPAAGNPFLASMLLGRFAPGAEPGWLQARRVAALPPITWATTTMVSELRGRRGDCDFVHLSNILDWLSPEAARETLRLARDALRPGGWVLVRQLNSVLEIPRLGEGLDWQPEEGQALLSRDRSFFYRAIHLGRRP